MELKCQYQFRNQTRLHSPRFQPWAMVYDLIRLITLLIPFSLNQIFHNNKVKQVYRIYTPLVPTFIKN
jgi:hypothetical protein